MQTEASVSPGCDVAGFLRAQLYGAFNATLDWAAADLNCEGMPRPDGAGGRLRFAGPIADGERQLAIIIAIPELTRDSAGAEHASNVTVIEEGGGRFFSTLDLSNCLTELDSVTAVEDGSDRYAIAGTLYCVSPLAEINGDSSVSIPELRFSGLIDWAAS